jgi:hypothetical protein
VGKPEHPEDYLAIQVGEWARRYGTIYVPWEIWGSLRPVSQEFIFYIQDQGRFRLEFDVPIGRLNV